MVRTGQTEGSVDLARLAGLHPVRGDLRDHEGRRHHGPHARPGEVRGRARLKIVTIADLISYRMRNESFVHRQAEVRLPTEYGEFIRPWATPTTWTTLEHVALVMGDIDPESRCWCGCTPSA